MERCGMISPFSSGGSRPVQRRENKGRMVIRETAISLMPFVGIKTNTWPELINLGCISTKQSLGKELTCWLYTGHA